MRAIVRAAELRKWIIVARSVFSNRVKPVFFEYDHRPTKKNFEFKLTLFVVDPNGVIHETKEWV